MVSISGGGGRGEKGEYPYSLGMVRAKGMVDCGVEMVCGGYGLLEVLGISDCLLFSGRFKGF